MDYYDSKDGLLALLQAAEQAGDIYEEIDYDNGSTDYRGYDEEDMLEAVAHRPKAGSGKRAKRYRCPGKLLPGGPCACCGAKLSPQWRRPLYRDDSVLCNACGIYWTRHKTLPNRKGGAASSFESFGKADIVFGDMAAEDTDGLVLPPEEASQLVDPRTRASCDSTCVALPAQVGHTSSPATSTADAANHQLRHIKQPRRTSQLGATAATAVNDASVHIMQTRRSSHQGGRATSPSPSETSSFTPPNNLSRKRPAPHLRTARKANRFSNLGTAERAFADHSEEGDENAADTGAGTYGVVVVKQETDQLPTAFGLSPTDDPALVTHRSGESATPAIAHEGSPEDVTQPADTTHKVAMTVAAATADFQMNSTQAMLPSNNGQPAAATPTPQLAYTGMTMMAGQTHPQYQFMMPGPAQAQCGVAPAAPVCMMQPMQQPMTQNNVNPSGNLGSPPAVMARPGMPMTQPVMFMRDSTGQMRPVAVRMVQAAPMQAGMMPANAIPTRPMQTMQKVTHVMPAQSMAQTTPTMRPPIMQGAGLQPQYSLNPAGLPGNGPVTGQPMQPMRVVWAMPPPGTQPSAGFMPAMPHMAQMQGAPAMHMNRPGVPVAGQQPTLMRMASMPLGQMYTPYMMTMQPTQTMQPHMVNPNMRNP